MPTPIQTSYIYALDGGPSSGSMMVNEGKTVTLCNSTTKNAEDVVYGDEVCLHSQMGRVVEVRKHIWYDDGSEAETIESP